LRIAQKNNDGKINQQKIFKNKKHVTSWKSCCFVLSLIFNIFKSNLGDRFSDNYSHSENVVLYENLSKGLQELSQIHDKFL